MARPLARALAVTAAVAAAFPTGALATGEPTVTQTATADVAAQALKYQPELIVARSDRFWPISARWVARLSDAAKRTCVHDDNTSCGPLAGLDGLLPGVDTHADLVYPAPLKDVDGEARVFDLALGIPPDAIAHWLQDPRANPYPTAQLYVYVAGPNRVPTYATGLALSQKRLDPRLVTVEYWFFYGFNYLPIVLRDPSLLGRDPRQATRRNGDYHQGDFEHVDVLYDPTTGTPAYVYFARHTSEGVVLPWSSPDLELVGTHPRVYVGFGGHASYNHCGAQRRSVSTRVVGTAVTAHPVDYAVCPEGGLGATAIPAGPTFDFAPATTPLVELLPASWACWPGLFGRRLKTHAGPLDYVRQAADGPKAPLRQAENSGLCASGPRAPSS